MSFAGVSFSYAPGNQHQSGTLGKAPQLVERVIANDGVRGSIPLSGPQRFSHAGFLLFSGGSRHPPKGGPAFAPFDYVWT